MLIQPKSIGGGASAFVDLTDGPGTIESLKALRGNAGAAALEWYTPIDTPFAFNDDWVNVRDYGAAGVITTTTLAATLNFGSTSATLASASSYAIGHGMAIPGAGVAGAELEVILTNVVGNVVSWAGATSTLVSSGQTVHHDDTAAIEAAYATGKHVYLPRGNYNVRRKLTFTTAYQNIRGAGCVYGATMIYSRVLNNDTIAWEGNYAVWSYICVTMDASLSPTSGAGIVLGNASTAKVNCTLEHASTLNMYDGVRIAKVNNVQVDEVVLSNSRRYGIHLKCGIPTGGGCVNRVIIYLGSPSWSATTLAGFFAEEMDTSRWSNINITGYPILMHFYATGSGLAQLLFTNVILENQAASSTYAIKMEKIGTNLINIGFSRLEIQPASGGPGTVYIGAGADRIDFDGFTCTGINGKAFDVYGSNVTLNNGFCTLNSGTHTAINIASGATNVTVANLRKVSGFNTGLAIANSVTGMIVHDNDFSGSTTPASIGTGVRATAKIHDNIGIDSWITSIAATPEFTGQEALSGGHFYKAIGTSSSADWKQTTV